MNALTLSALLTFFSLAALSCSAPVTSCERTCAGCCDANGACQLGNAANVCGAQGLACQACPLGLTCALGSCVSPATGGGTGAGGGSATGGGTTGGGTGSACAGTLSLCGGTCTDLTSSLDNCGACGRICGNGQVCIQGSCRLFPDDCTTTACGAGFTCDPMSRKCVAGCRLQSDCPQGAQCSNGTCACPSGQHACGQRCVNSLEITSCGGACQTCRAPPNASPTCEGTGCGFACNVGFTRVGDACVDVDECRTNNGGCDANATCTNTDGDRTCACMAGFTGSGLTCSDVDECATNNGGCDANATCTNSAGGRSCACKTGFTGSGATCSDIDECQNGTAGCASNATCTNSQGSFTCTCNAGLSGDGRVCRPGHDFIVLVVGNGAAPLAAQATEVHLQRHRTDGSLASDTALPTSPSGANAPLTVMASATSEGMLSLSDDGRYVLLAGYSATPGEIDFTGLSRVVGRVPVSGGAVDTTTRFSLQLNGGARSAGSADGSIFWVGTSSEGLRMVVYGATSASTSIFSTPSAVRQVVVEGGQLFALTSQNIRKVGQGLPMSTATSTSLPGVTVQGATGMALFDLNPAVSGPDRLYLSESQSSIMVRRFDFDGTTWSPTATWAAPSVGEVASMAAASDPGAVSIIVTGVFGVMRISDPGVSGAQPTGTVLVPPVTNKSFRGVVVLP